MKAIQVPRDPHHLLLNISKAIIQSSEKAEMDKTGQKKAKKVQNEPKNPKRPKRPRTFQRPKKANDKKTKKY